MAISIKRVLPMCPSGNKQPKNRRVETRGPDPSWLERAFPPRHGARRDDPGLGILTAID